MKRHGILINRNSSVPLHRQLESSLRNAILSGSLPAGERIVSSRELQTHLGLSRNTILDALAQLHAEGYLVTTRGVGTFVAPHVHGLPAHEKSRPETPIVPSTSADRYASMHGLAANLQGDAPFRPGLPALDLFPSAQLKRAFDASGWTPAVLDYPNAFGYEPLRAAIARRLQQTRGIVCSVDQILITGGAQAAFSLVARVMLDANDVAVIEDPGYSSVRAILLARGAKILAAPVDEAGIDVSSFRKRRAKLAYVTPSHQYPTGAVLSLDRRLALLDWAAKNDGWIIEDDYDSEFNYTGRPQPALQGLGDGRRVIYVGTFSKVLSPALRIAYLVIPQSLRSSFEAVHQITHGPPSTIVQSALARFMDDGHLSRHIAKMRRIYDQRRCCVSAELEKVAGSVFRVRDSRAGLHFIAELPRNVRDADFSRRAARQGIIVPALSSYFHGESTLNGIVVGYAATSIPDARRAVAAMVDAL
ncbi:MAG TPA: PLP-dependent aminotransferase family protein [Candidatus Baltobacteraceae bacterium]